MLLNDIGEAIHMANSLDKFWPPRFILISNNLVDEIAKDIINTSVYYHNYGIINIKDVKENILRGKVKYMGLTIKVLNEKDYEDGFSIL